MTTSIRTRGTSLRDHLRASWRILLKEIASFGVVGAVGFVIQLGLFNLLFDIGQVTANAIAMSVAVVVTYFGNRYLSFSHRARTGLGREAGVFFGINAIAFVFAELLTLVFSYPLHYKGDKFVMNVVVIVGIGIGTLFRFWSYKRFVFLHPDRVGVGPAAVSDDEALAA